MSSQSQGKNMTNQNSSNKNLEKNQSGFQRFYSSFSPGIWVFIFVTLLFLLFCGITEGCSLSSGAIFCADISLQSSTFDY